MGVSVMGGKEGRNTFRSDPQALGPLINTYYIYSRRQGASCTLSCGLLWPTPQAGGRARVVKAQTRKRKVQLLAPRSCRTRKVGKDAQLNPLQSVCVCVFRATNCSVSG